MAGVDLNSMDCEQYESYISGKSVYELEQIDKALMRQKKEDVGARIDEVFSSVKALKDSGFTDGYSDLCLPDYMLDAIVNDDAIELMRLVRNEIEASAKHEVGE